MLVFIHMTIENKAVHSKDIGAALVGKCSAVHNSHLLNQDGGRKVRHRVTPDVAILGMLRIQFTWITP